MLPTPTDPHSATFNNKVTYFFNPADFANNALGTEGNAGRGILHGPGFWNFDASLQKETKITERMSLTLGASAFNFFNHTNFGQPSGSFSSANFGRVTGIASNSNSRIVQLDARFRF